MFKNLQKAHKLLTSMTIFKKLPCFVRAISGLSVVCLSFGAPAQQNYSQLELQTSYES